MSESVGSGPASSVTGRWPLCLGVVAGISLAIPATAASYTSKGVGVVAALRGQVSVARSAEVAAREGRPREEALKFRDDVFFRDVISTETGAAAKILLRGRATLTVRELSRVEVQAAVGPADPGRTRSIMRLLAGALRALVQPDLRPQDEMEIHTPNAVAAVRGTDVVVEVYQDAAPPPLPAGAALEQTIQPVSFDVAQAPAGIITRIFVITGELQAEGVIARALQGIEKVGNLPPRLFRFTPDAMGRIIGRFGVGATQAPTGQSQRQAAAAQAARAAAEGSQGVAAPFRGQEAPRFFERVVDPLQVNREIFINGTVEGVLTVSSIRIGLAVITLQNGTKLVTAFDGGTSPPLGALGTKLFTGTVSGTTRLLGGAPGTVQFRINPVNFGIDTFQATLRGPLTLVGPVLIGPAGGNFQCIGSCGPVTGGIGGFFHRPIKP